MAEVFYSDPRNITIEKRNVRIEVARLKHSIKRDLRNFFGKYGLDRETGMLDDIDIPAGQIEDIVFRRGLLALTVGTDEVRFTSTSPVDDLPDFAMGDEEGEVDLYEEILKTIVDKNRFLANQYPFGMVFAQYLAMVQDDKRNHDKEEADKKNEKPAEEEKPASEDNPEEVSPNPLSKENVDTSIEDRISGSQLSASKS